MTPRSKASGGLRPGMIEFSKMEPSPEAHAAIAAIRRYNAWIDGKKDPEKAMKTPMGQKLQRAQTAAAEKMSLRLVKNQGVLPWGKKARERKQYNVDADWVNSQLDSLTPGMIEFDGRPRNGNGQFVANETGGVDPSSMAAAYGPAAEEKARKAGILERFKAMLGGGR